MSIDRKDEAGHRAAESPEYDAIVIGAGMSGMYQLYRLRELGLKTLVLEAGSGVGGTWYWNKYPGARFDSESWSYGYSFNEEILKEWSWSEHFAGQPEIKRYCDLVADKLELCDDIRFKSRVAEAQYLEDRNIWRVQLTDGTEFFSRYLITGIGLLSIPTMPRFEGVNDFKGTWCHTGLWPEEGIDYDGKRVAVIGTGASGIQAVQEIAKTAKSLTIFQRRPNWCTPLHNSPISEQKMEDIRSRYPEIFKHCQTTAACFIHTHDPRDARAVSKEERLAFWEELYKTPGFGIWQGNFHQIHTDREINREISDFVADKIRQRVKDPKVAEQLIPKDHGFGTRRVPQETGYYEVFNQDNVELIPVLETPIERITPTGIRTTEREFEFDVIIYATGFDGITGAFDQIDFQGADGQTLREEWKDGPTTFVGMMVKGFPNMFMVMGPHGALGNQPRSIEHNVDWISRIIGHMEEEGITKVTPKPAAVDEWHDFVAEKAKGLLANEVDSWMTGVNMNVKGKEKRGLVRYSGTAPEFRARCEAVITGGHRELEFTRPTIAFPLSNDFTGTKSKGTGQ
ncbi:MULTISPECIES: flavin-containing monooxygenase [Marinovum]|uniref:flavin-containing monooxygenase n=1 Tax=Marinovum TaxID=367771 RepID=UPI00237AA49E|nr:NAD(P)/FAD-dependent oxidoreductase [Marinovum sp. PR37]MDD9746412.1 NAD(P)/FAD-dependent oxidoreductase [Marinovum sp. PR37]